MRPVMRTMKSTESRAITAQPRHAGRYLAPLRAMPAVHPHPALAAAAAYIRTLVDPDEEGLRGLMDRCAVRTVARRWIRRSSPLAGTKPC